MTVPGRSPRGFGGRPALIVGEERNEGLPREAVAAGGGHHPLHLGHHVLHAQHRARRPGAHHDGRHGRRGHHRDRAPQHGPRQACGRAVRRLARRHGHRRLRPVLHPAQGRRPAHGAGLLGDRRPCGLRLRVRPCAGGRGGRRCRCQARHVGGPDPHEPRHIRHLGAGLLGGHHPADRLRPHPALAAVIGHQDSGVLHPAHHRPGRALRGIHRPRHPHVHARGALPGLHAHGGGQGAPLLGHRGAPRPAQRPHPDHHHRGHTARRHLHRLHPHREHLLNAGHGQDDARRHQRP